MRTDVLNRFRLRLARSAAVVSVAALTAGCSADATRLQDGFYTGAIPKASIQNTQMAGAPAPMGQPMPPAQPGYGAGNTNASQTYAAVATPPVSRSTLPPPPAASYNGGGSSYPAMSQAAPNSQPPIGTPQISQTQAGRAMSGDRSQPGMQATNRPTASGGTYTVTSGDSILGIARRNGVKAADLRAANGLSSDDIRIGQVLTLPGGAARSTRVASLGAPPTSLQAQAATIPAPRSSPAKPASAAALPAVTAPKAASSAMMDSKPVKAAAAPAAAAPVASTSVVAAAAPAAPATTMAQEEKQEQASLAPASTGIDQFRWPVQGRVVKNFGDKVGSRRNDGLNISVPRGTPVKAAENGVVIYAGEGLKEFGKTVLVKHDNGLVTVYGHADDILVQRGSTVKRGQEIAKAGMTGDTDTPMLHFEVRKDSSPVNPMTYLQ